MQLQLQSCKRGLQIAEKVQCAKVQNEKCKRKLQNIPGREYIADRRQQNCNLQVVQLQSANGLHCTEECNCKPSARCRTKLLVPLCPVDQVLLVGLLYG